MPHLALSAVAPSQRLRLLDVLRGFAIFGILLVNVHFYSRPIYVIFREPGGMSAADRVVQVLTLFFVTEKFFSILSVLFGIGMAILFERALEKGARFGAVYLRRLAGLFAIGITHALTLYAGDFIGNYAVLGLLLFVFRKARPRTLLVWSALTLAVPSALMVQGLLSAPAAPAAAQSAEAQQVRQEKRRVALERRIQESVQVYREGTVQEMFRHRSREVVMQYSSLLFVGWKMFAMFLLGLWCWKSGLVRSLEHRLPFVRKVMWIALLVGVAGSAVSVWSQLGGAGQGGAMRLLGSLGQDVGAPALGIFYMCAIALLSRGGAGRRLLDLLAPVGQMAMSNYVFQSLVCTTIFYSYGLGLYYKTSYATNVLIALVLFAVQVILSRAWLRHFGFGPLEWILRTFVYLGRPTAAPQPAPSPSTPEKTPESY